MRVFESSRRVLYSTLLFLPFQQNFGYISLLWLFHLWMPPGPSDLYLKLEFHLKLQLHWNKLPPKAQLASLSNLIIVLLRFLWSKKCIITLILTRLICVQFKYMIIFNGHRILTYHFHYLSYQFFHHFSSLQLQRLQRLQDVSA